MRILTTLTEITNQYSENGSTVFSEPKWRKVYINVSFSYQKQTIKSLIQKFTKYKKEEVSFTNTDIRYMIWTCICVRQVRGRYLQTTPPRHWTESAADSACALCRVVTRSVVGTFLDYRGRFCRSFWNQFIFLLSHLVCNKHLLHYAHFLIIYSNNIFKLYIWGWLFNLCFNHIFPLCCFFFWWYFCSV